MGKHSKKRQRTTKDDDTSDLKPLGSVVTLANDDNKDEEEKRLETLLFGTTFPPSSDKQMDALLHENKTTAATRDAGGELGNLMDSDVSCIRFLAVLKLTFTYSYSSSTMLGPQ